MKRMIIAVAAATMLASAASANAPSVYVDGSSKAHIRYADLDLHSKAGRDELTGRIRLAAHMLCTAEADPILLGWRAQCLRSLIVSGDSAMNLIASR